MAALTQSTGEPPRAWKRQDDDARARAHAPHADARTPERESHKSDARRGARAIGQAARAERRAADRDSMPHEYARVVALSRVKGGRIAHVSQVVGDLVLRVPNVTNESAFALEVIVTGRRYRLDVLKSDLESVHTKEEITELSEMRSPS